MTQTTTAQADLDTGTITHQVRIAAPRDVVFKALVTSEHIEKWWGHPNEFPDGIKAGSVGVFHWQDQKIDVRIDRVDPPEHFTMTWGFGADLDESKSTTCHFEVLEDGDGSIVRVTESGFDKLEDLAERRAQLDDHSNGWNQVLASIGSYAETMPAA
ncbi:SRPBCC domain-containing protein [Nocardioides panacisoli]|uniref:SRPBCC family protein n=1 Tax=Nocardioides panacisoli TaxID=627624 RepID=A0ABP7I382_9ACTN